MTASPIRHDLDIYNDAFAFSVTSQSALEQMIQCDDDMQGLFQKRLVIAQELVEDEAFSARVVVGDDLTPEEEGWLGCVTGILHIPCGKLLVCAGFDLDALYDFNRTGQNEYIHLLDVPPGTYRVDIYTYVNSINGGFCLSDTVKLGSWFRRSYPDTPFPLWLAAICEQDPSQDPGYETMWADLEQSVRDGQITLDSDPTALIDFVIQLRPLGNDLQLSPLEDTEDGFFAPHTGARLPKQFPLGVRSATLPSNDYEMGLLLNEAEDDKPATAAGLTADTVFVQRILTNFSGHRIEDLQGGPLQQPPDLLQQFARLTWFCDPDADFVLYIRTPPGTAQGLSWPFAADLPRPQGDESYIGIPWYSAQQRTRAIQEVSTFLRALPDNSRIDFIAANEDPSLEAGCQCYQSVMRHGQWYVTASYPPTNRSTLAAALDLCRTVDQPGPLYARTEDEASAIMDAAEQSEFFMFDFARPQQTGRQITIDDACKISLVLLFFRQHFGDTWNVAEAQLQHEYVPVDSHPVPYNRRSQTLSALFQAWHPHHATSEDLMSDVPSLESIDVMMHAMGFDLLGDMRCEHGSDGVRRGYACTDSQTFALLTVGTDSQHSLNFHTRFDDNSSQTTTSIARLDDRARAGTLCTSSPDTDYQTLYTLHLQHIEQKRAQGVQIQAITPTLEALAACLDECLQPQGL